MAAASSCCGLTPVSLLFWWSRGSLSFSRLQRIPSWSHVSCCIPSSPLSFYSTTFHLHSTETKLTLTVSPLAQPICFFQKMAHLNFPSRDHATAGVSSSDGRHSRLQH
jgi:hypothetical protein